MASTFSIITNDATLISTCLGPPQPDVGGKIAKRRAKLNDEVLKCIDKGVASVGPAFPGACTGASNATFGQCASQRIACRFCLAINIADDISPALNCDQFDDGLLNASCP